VARILVIEDNADNLELMVYLLEAFGHAVTAAVDGAGGLAAAASERPEVILCDLHLPGIDGYEVCRRLQADRALRRIPLLAVTASAMAGDRDRGLATGFDGYIAKPIDPERFVTEVESFLSAGGRGEAARRAE
jgi:CheY-like chemotaxis protein